MERPSGFLLAAFGVTFATLRAWLAQSFPLVAAGSVIAIALLVAELIRSRRPNA